MSDKLFLFAKSWGWCFGRIKCSSDTALAGSVHFRQEQIVLPRLLLVSTTVSRTVNLGHKAVYKHLIDGLEQTLM